MIAVPVIEGNIGARQWPGDSQPQYVLCRASRAGQAVLDAEARRSAPVPAGLINGTAYRGGVQPPLEPSRVIAALRHLLDHLAQRDRHRQESLATGPNRNNDHTSRSSITRRRG